MAIESEELRTIQQNNILYGLFHSKGIGGDDKDTLILSYTNGRTQRSSLMTKKEADELIHYLQGLKPGRQPFIRPGDKQRKKILSNCHELRWFEKYDEGKQRMAIDINALDEWLLRHGAVRKKLNAMNLKELNKVVSQFNEINKKEFTK